MPEPIMIIAATSLVGLTIVAGALLRAWHGWLELKRQELEGRSAKGETDAGSSIGAARIELSDLKERIKKLEAIASGVDL